MGLDAVEIVMATEEAFGIEITDEEAEKTLTVGDLETIVLRKLELASDAICRTQRAFHLLRKKAIQELGFARRSFRPEAELESIFPITNRRDLWKRYGVIMQVEGWHSLGLSKPVLTAWIATFPLAMLAAFIAVLNNPRSSSGWIILGCGIAVFAAAGIALNPLRTNFPQEIRTIRDLAYSVASHNPKLVEQTGFSKGDVFPMLRTIISEQLGVDKEKVQREARFVQDLGLS